MKCTHKQYVYIDSYCVRGALQQEIDGSVYIFVAVMEGNHALILSLPSYLNQLWVLKTETHMMHQGCRNSGIPEN